VDPSHAHNHHGFGEPEAPLPEARFPSLMDQIEHDTPAFRVAFPRLRKLAKDVEPYDQRLRVRHISVTISLDALRYHGKTELSAETFRKIFIQCDDPVHQLCLLGIRLDASHISGVGPALRAAVYCESGEAETHRSWFESKEWDVTDGKADIYPLLVSGAAPPSDRFLYLASGDTGTRHFHYCEALTSNPRLAMDPEDQKYVLFPHRPEYTLNRGEALRRDPYMASSALAHYALSNLHSVAAVPKEEVKITLDHLGIKEAAYKALVLSFRSHPHYFRTLCRGKVVFTAKAVDTPRWKHWFNEVVRTANPQIVVQLSLTVLAVVIGSHPS
jgi:hypothetical protein